MLNNFLGKFYEKTQGLASAPLLYGLGLSSGDAVQLHHVPSYLHGGDAGRGQWLASGVFEYAGTQIAMGEDVWDNQEILQHEFWSGYAAAFGWLKDLKALGGDIGRLSGRRMMSGWIEAYPTYRASAQVWDAGHTAQRLVNWLMHYDFFVRSAPDDFIAKMHVSMGRQMRYLIKIAGTPRMLKGAKLAVGRALMIGGLCFDGYEEAVEQGKDLIEAALKDDLLSDGGHVTRSPKLLLDCACDVMDVIMLAKKAQYYGCANILQHLDRMLQALRFFRMRDGGLPLFHQTQETDGQRLLNLFRYADSRSRKILSGLPESGFERIAQGSTQIVMDVGSPPKHKASARAHAGLLAFEFMRGKDRIFVNCGTHPLCGDWQHILKSTAAHTALTMDERNACEILPDGHIGRAPAAPKLRRNDSKSGMLIEAEHAGYQTSFGVAHMRRLYLTDKGRDLRGEDVLLQDGQRVLKNAVPFALRFHLHPRVHANIVQGGQDVLLKVPHGRGWRFRQEGAELSLEPSVYLGRGGVPRKTMQIVLRENFDGGMLPIKWALQQEG